MTYDDWKSTEPPEQGEPPDDNERLTKARRSLKVQLWVAIQEYAVACGGDPGSHVYDAVARQRAVVDVGNAVRKLEDLAVEAAGIK